MTKGVLFLGLIIKWYIDIEPPRKDNDSKIMIVLDFWLKSLLNMMMVVYFENWKWTNKSEYWLLKNYIVLIKTQEAKCLIHLLNNVITSNFFFKNPGQSVHAQSWTVVTHLYVVPFL